MLAGLIMTAARPRLRVDRNGLWNRNVVGESFVPWPLVMRIAFPQGANWAQLMMPDDETKPLMAIQAMDKGRAVAALERVRELQRQYGPPPPVPPADGGADCRPAAAAGPAREIDLQKAAERDRDAARKAARRAKSRPRSSRPGNSREPGAARSSRGAARSARVRSNRHGPDPGTFRRST